MREYSFKELYYKSMLKAIKDFVEILKADKTLVIDIHQYFSTLSAAGLEDLLEENGWDRIDYESHNQGNWITMTHKDYDFNIVIYFNGYYGTLKLRKMI